MLIMTHYLDDSKLTVVLLRNQDNIDAVTAITALERMALGEK